LTEYTISSTSRTKNDEQNKSDKNSYRDHKVCLVDEKIVHVGKICETYVFSLNNGMNEAVMENDSDVYEISPDVS